MPWPARPDLNTPDSVPDGALDWMGLAHMLDEPGVLGEIAGLGPRRPLLAPDRVLLFAHDPGHETEAERERVTRLGLGGPEVSEVAADPPGTAAAVRERAGSRVVHFDVDVVDFVDLPLSENTGRNSGLRFDAAMTALAELLADDGLLALTVTELNPHHGAEDGATLAAFAQRLATVLGDPGAQSPPA